MFFMVTRYSMTQHMFTPEMDLPVLHESVISRQDVADELFRISRVPSLAAKTGETINVTQIGNLFVILLGKIDIERVWRSEFGRLFLLVRWIKMNQVCFVSRVNMGSKLPVRHINTNCQNPKMAKHDTQQPIACKAAAFPLFDLNLGGGFKHGSECIHPYLPHLDVGWKRKHH